METDGLLRRRGNLEPLVAPQGRELDDIEPFTSVYISPCQTQISNDPYKNTSYADMVPCNRTTFECPSALTNVSSTTNVTVLYDFEIYYKTGLDLETALVALEGYQLQHAAYFMGLLDCGAVSFGRSGSIRTLKSQELLSSSEKAAIVAISSDPRDIPDPDHGTFNDFASCLSVSASHLRVLVDCIVPVESSVSSGANCVPIKGSITATVDSSASATTKDGILRGILRVVRQGMADDVYVSGDIKQVSFIGSRTDTSNSERSSSTAGSQSDAQAASVSNIGIAFICIGVVLLLTLIALLVTKRQRKKAEERNMIFHDATVEAQALALDKGGDTYHHRGAVVETAALEGADIPGSLANKDELALKPDPFVVIKTGDLRVDDDPVIPYSPPRKSSSLTTTISPTRVDHLADTQSFGSSTENEDESFGRSVDTDADSMLNLSADNEGVSREGAQP
jgi:hypothetical protein